MRVFVVIPVYNRKDMTRDCLLSLYHQSASDFQVIVVDDGSTDGTSEMISQEFPDVILLKGDGNLWWTGSINKGIRYALDICNADDHILILNDDLVMPQNYIATLARLASNFPNTLIGSVVIDIDDRDTIRSGGIIINWRTAKQHHNLNAGKKRSSFPEGFYTEVSTLTGRGVLIPSKVFREIGLYSDQHYRHFGDPELPKRAEKAGYRLIVSYDAVVYSYREDPNHINHREEYRLSDIRNYFWSIRSKANLRDRFWFAYDTSSGFWQGTRYLFFDLARVTFHFVKRLRLR